MDYAKVLPAIFSAYASLASPAFGQDCQAMVPAQNLIRAIDRHFSEYTATYAEAIQLKRRLGNLAAIPSSREDALILLPRLVEATGSLDRILKAYTRTSEKAASLIETHPCVLDGKVAAWYSYHKVQLKKMELDLREFLKNVDGSQPARAPAKKKLFI